MANEKKKQKKRHLDKRFFVFLFLAIIYLVYLYYNSNSTQNEPTDKTLKVHMIDCGQGDCFLFEEDGKYALIDCGTRSSAKDVVKYLKDENVEELQFVIGTHHHDDHMGGMYEVLKNYKCNTVYMPEIKDGLVTTNWYIKLMDEISEMSIKLINPSVGDEFYLDETKFKVVGQFSPKQAESNINNYSTVIQVTLGEMDLLFTGDAETKVEREMIKQNNLNECEVLKLGHHGSDTSTSKELIKIVNPEYGLISCGVGNKYEHPCTATMEKLKDQKVEVYRTDELGSVVVSVTANDIKFDKSPGDYKDGITIAKEQEGKK